MKKSEIKGALEWIRESAEHYCRNPNDPEFGWWAHCQLPDTLEKIGETFTPWYIKAWWWIKYQIKRPFQTLDDEIPF